MPALAGDHVQVLVGGYELTADVHRLMVNEATDMHDATSFGDDMHKFIPGQRVSSMEHQGYLDASTTARSHPVLRGLVIDGPVSFIVGQNATPVVGNAMYSLIARQSIYRAMPEAQQIIPFMAQFTPAEADCGGWGVALQVPTAGITNTAAGTALDNGAATTGGALALLHITQAAAPDTYSITVEGSSTGAFGGEQTTLVTFSLNGSAIGSTRQRITGPIPRYLRYRAVRTGTAGNTLKFSINLIRF